MPDVQFFSSRAAFRDWLRANHDSQTEVLLAFYKKGAGENGVSYVEAIEESLCFGWIDGVRRSRDAGSYIQRFTPRKKRSTWSTVNINRFRELQALGLVEPAGLAAFEARSDDNSAIYAFEQGDIVFDPEQQSALEANGAAWAYWQKAAKSYRKTATWWVVSAKRPETRAKRLAELIACSANGEKIPSQRR